jgi:serine protease Do
MSKSTLSILVFLAFLVLGFWPGTGAAVPSQRITPVVRAVNTIMPSVVSIGTNERRVVLKDAYEQYFSEFFDPHYRYVTEYIPLGSGVVVDAGGLILTNYHVVARARNIRVRLASGEEYAAIPVARAKVNDLCLLELQGFPANQSLVAAQFALPDDLLLGETVVTVGNPFGLEQSVAQGVLSAKNRSYYLGNDMVFNDILQTDAAINPGNSGGPLVNLDGQLIGINLAIRKDAQGIGFAIPLERIEKVLTSWLIPERRSPACLGLVPGTQVVDGQLRAVIQTVRPDSPAEAAGLRPGMVVEAANGVPVERGIDLGRILFRLGDGDPLELNVGRGKTVALKSRRMTPEELVQQRLGLRVQPLNEALARALGVPGQFRALAISEIDPASDIAQFRNQYGNLLRRGDLLVSVNGNETTTVEGLAKLLEGTHGGMTARIVFYAIDTVNRRVTVSPLEVEVNLD